MHLFRNFKITKDLINELKNALKVIFGIEDFSIIEINKASLKVIVSLLNEKDV